MRPNGSEWVREIEGKTHVIIFCIATILKFSDSEAVAAALVAQFINGKQKLKDTIAASSIDYAYVVERYFLMGAQNEHTMNKTQRREEWEWEMEVWTIWQTENLCAVARGILHLMESGFK